MEAIFSTNEVNNYSVSELNYIRETIENMNKFNQIEVLRILTRHSDVILNENKYHNINMIVRLTMTTFKY